MIESAAVFTVIGGKAKYEHNSAMVFAQFLNCFGFFWFTQFLFGCQHLIVGGSVGKWFFTR
jgi:solute carrier family 44 (choline transporter-like protein), member 1